LYGVHYTAQLVIAFESGTIVLWDLKSRTADVRFMTGKPLRAISPHYDGRQFVAAHQDGTLSIWKTDKPKSPAMSWAPHGSGAFSPPHTQRAGQ